MSDSKPSVFDSVFIDMLAIILLLMLATASNDGCIGKGGLTYYVDGVEHTISIGKKP